MRGRYWLWLAGAIPLAVIVIAVVTEPTGVVRGWLQGEAIHQGRPTSYWREVLRAEAEAGALGDQTFEVFSLSSSGVPVLGTLLKDPDANVRRPAAFLLSRVGWPHEAVPLLRDALKDPDTEVRLKVTAALYRRGPNASMAAPALAELLSDPVPQVAHNADLALWRVHPPTALKAEGWKTYTSAEWSFSAVFPADPQVGMHSATNAYGPVVLHTFMAPHGVTHCAVTVTNYPPEYVDATTEQERFGDLRAFAPLGLEEEWKIVQEKSVEQAGLAGREFLIEVKSLGRMRSRLFWTGPRLYHVMTAYKPEFLNPAAADYFMDSFSYGGGKKSNESK